MNEVQPLLEKAERSFRAAERILADGDVDFAASRAYYGCFYIAQALLLTRNLSFSRHGQVIAQYGFHFAKTRLLDPAFHSLLDHAFGVRQGADYAVNVPIQPGKVTEIIREGRRFLEAAYAYLRKDLEPSSEMEG